MTEGDPTQPKTSLVPGAVVKLFMWDKIPEKTRKGLESAGVFPNKQYLIVAIGQPTEGTGPVAFVAPPEISVKKMQDFNMEDYLYGDEYDEVTAVPLEFLERAPLH